MARSDYEEEIIKLLKAQRRALPTFRISKKTDMSWPTARKYLQDLEKRGRVTRNRRGKKTFWEV